MVKWCRGNEMEQFLSTLPEVYPIKHLQTDQDCNVYNNSDEYSPIGLLAWRSTAFKRLSVKPSRLSFCAVSESSIFSGQFFHVLPCLLYHRIIAQDSACK
ncbi:jg18077 [Pararge aegeria aegeria]|uniref:Jg18077 protein n=1 Tax=Pararge aegeria aegeria TaxID=348720 RepID=A0A8S4RQZ0_9NEOP|nr:jg18077 [Pararge aegeria aegeria]